MCTIDTPDDKEDSNMPCRHAIEIFLVTYVVHMYYVCRHPYYFEKFYKSGITDNIESGSFIDHISIDDYFIQDTEQVTVNPVTIFKILMGTETTVQETFVFPHSKRKKKDVKTNKGTKRNNALVAEDGTDLTHTSQTPAKKPRGRKTNTTGTPKDLTPLQWSRQQNKIWQKMGELIPALQGKNILTYIGTVIKITAEQKQLNGYIENLYNAVDNHKRLLKNADNLPHDIAYNMLPDNIHNLNDKYNQHHQMILGQITAENLQLPTPEDENTPNTSSEKQPPNTSTEKELSRYEIVVDNGMIANITSTSPTSAAQTSSNLEQIKTTYFNGQQQKVCTPISEIIKNKSLTGFGGKKEKNTSINRNLFKNNGEGDENENEENNNIVGKTFYVNNYTDAELLNEEVENGNNQEDDKDSTENTNIVSQNIFTL